MVSQNKVTNFQVEKTKKKFFIPFSFKQKEMAQKILFIIDYIYNLQIYKIFIYLFLTLIYF